MFDHTTAPGAADDQTKAQNALADGVSRLAFEIVDISGLLANIDTNTSDSVSRLTDLRSSAVTIGQAVTGMTQKLDEIETATTQSVERAKSALADMKDGASKARSVASWVQDLGPRMTPMGDGLGKVRSSANRISEIATEINMLAINARIEAARAGENGKGFTVVSDAIGVLSKQTAEVTAAISDQIRSFGDTVASMIEEADAKSTQATDSLKLATQNDADMAGIADALSVTSAGIQSIAADARRAGKESATFVPTFSEVTGLMEENAKDIHKAGNRLDGLTDSVERNVQLTVAAGGASEDSAMIEIVTQTAARVSAAFEDALASGRISLSALFDTKYRPLHGTNPQQVVTGFTNLTDAILPQIQEPVSQLDRRIVFCAAVDRNGYLPTHNAKFSQPQGSDPIWNAANSRNRRIFDDRVGAKAGQSKARFLLQVYRREMGGGKTVLMKDLSSPITVQGRHWGGLRLAYKLS